jgi:homoserine dehydrogenase
LLKVAIAGLGTVGGGVARLLSENKEIIKKRTDKDIKIVALSDIKKVDLGISMEGVTWFDDALEMVEKSDADVVVELIGGSKGIAKTLCEKALGMGKSVVTANKALIAHHGLEFAKLAKENDCDLCFEAAVGGGIPILKSIRESLAGNNIEYVYGILNGTCNYILTTMRETGREFDDVLAEAQELGYAEADPTFDIDGIDTAHKTAILASLAFGTKVDFDALDIEGIRHISPVDIAYAEELGYRIKLIGTARKSGGKVEHHVHPLMIGKDSPLAKVEGVFNAVVTHGDFVGRSVFEGRGAGEKPTASAVVSDIIDIAKELKLYPFGVDVEKLDDLEVAPIEELESLYYIRLHVIDQPGVFAAITNVLQEEKISMKTLIQREEDNNGGATVVMTLHKTVEKKVNNALKKLEALKSVMNKPRVIRIESF